MEGKMTPEMQAMMRAMMAKRMGKMGKMPPDDAEDTPPKAKMKPGKMPPGAKGHGHK